MNKKYTQEQRTELLSRYKSGEKVSQIHVSTGIPKSTIYAWIKEERTKSENIQPQLTQRQFRTLTNKVARLDRIIEILHQVNCSANAPLLEKLQAIVDLQGQYSIRMLCDALKVPTGTYYNHILRNKKENAWYVKWCQELREKVQRIFDESNQVYVAGKIVAVLRKEGCNTSEKQCVKL